ncbi:MAG TPA: amidohydrolase family protein [Acidimicrobiia bacterium]
MTVGDASLETPGLVSAHHHLSASLARGMPSPARPPANFVEVLERVWWRLDRALDLELVRWSARLGALEALEAGTTGIVDLHSSPNAIEGSLDVVADACAEVGVRVRCSYEVTDRNGLDGAEAGLAENERFVRAGGDGFVGAHACFTLSDDTLDAVSDLAADLGVGVHLHVAEAEADAGAGSRLLVHADQSWLLAHAVHLERSLPGVVAHNPRSNLTNAVGYARPVRFERVALGTDGLGGDMLEEFRLAFALARAHDLDFAPECAWKWLQTGHQLVPGAACDRVTWNHAPMDPQHLATSPGVRPVRVVVGGEVVLDESGPTRVDAMEIRARAREESRRLFSRMAEL